MKKIVRNIAYILAGLITFLLVFGLYLNRGLSVEIQPATFDCLDLKNGYYNDFDTIPS